MMKSEPNHRDELQRMVRLSSIATVISNPKQFDNPIVACNEQFLALTGYDEDQVIGHNCRFLAGANTEPWLTDVICEGVRQRRPVLVDILNYRKDGTPFRNAVSIAPIFDEQGGLDLFIGSQVELDGTVGDNLISTRRFAARRRVDDLSPRHQQILILVARGYRNKHIANELGLSEKTIKIYRSAMSRKLGVASSAELVRLAIEAGY